MATSKKSTSKPAAKKPKRRGPKPPRGTMKKTTKK